jgi:iron-sulfur cluster repair protein YtfE (RIC family)
MIIFTVRKLSAFEKALYPNCVSIIMKRHSVLANFSRDHHEALITSQLIRKGAPKYRGLPEDPAGKKEYVIRFFQTHLKDHFLKEEKILFAFSRGKSETTDTLIDELTAEHRLMEGLVQKIALTDDAAELLNDLGVLIETHIRKEERVLFQQLQEMLTAEDFNMLERRMSAS